jgi:hypothetical protein
LSVCLTRPQVPSSNWLFLLRGAKHAVDEKSARPEPSV